MSYYPGYGSHHGGSYGSSGYGSGGPFGGLAGYYDDTDDEPTSYLDVYASSSSASSSTSSGSQAAGSSRSSTRAQPQQPNESRDGWLAAGDPPSQLQPQWVFSSTGNQLPRADQFEGDLVTGGDQSLSAQRTLERHVLAPGRPTSGDRQRAESTPEVPASNTTPSPEFVMLNPSSSRS